MTEHEHGLEGSRQRPGSHLTSPISQEGSMFKQLKALFGKGQDRGFTLIELLIVVLIVGILAAVAVPLYLGYIKDAKMTEGKSVAGALWTSGQANSLANCGTAVALSVGYARAGLTGTQTAD